ncbi:unnamed protein product [Linum tenue]|uniref:UspA domain-containing protein n=1 Tax=Linum tenue TaxID=586396 RepID=A0AAV0LQR3_9ROSI|nr:unnamed protein product [Linum tenue]
MGSDTTTRKVMVVVDPSREAAGALQYALSHVVTEKDELILVHVETQNSWKNTFSFSFLRRTGILIPAVNNNNNSSSLNNGNQSSSGGEGMVEGEVDFLEAMRQLCEAARPRLKVTVERLQMGAKDKASVILFKSTAMGVDHLIIGQKKSLSSVLLGNTKYKKPGGLGPKSMDTAEYLIEYSKCNCVAVQKKGQTGGYLLNTKTQKNFWLLA